VPIGKMISDNKTFLKVACKNGYVHLLQIQLEGKKRIGVEEFLRGHKI
jgi:methionyl-tRNA formyltransferase